MVAGLGAAISTTASGFVAHRLGYTVSFIALAVAALAGLGVVRRFLPETSYKAKRDDGATSIR